MAVDLHGGQQWNSGFVPPPTTINRMELNAPIKALNNLRRRYGPCEIEVVSDSQYVVLGSQYPERTRSANRDLWWALDEAISRHTYVQWRHVNGHIGVKYNELADELAVQARKGAVWE